jgi:hypothetical protein
MHLPQHRVASLERISREYEVRHNMCVTIFIYRIVQNNRQNETYTDSVIQI